MASASRHVSHCGFPGNSGPFRRWAAGDFSSDSPLIRSDCLNCQMSSVVRPAPGRNCPSGRTGACPVPTAKRATTGKEQGTRTDQEKKEEKNTPYSVFGAAYLVPAIRAAQHSGKRASDCCWPISPACIFPLVVGQSWRVGERPGLAWQPGSLAS